MELIFTMWPRFLFTIPGENFRVKIATAVTAKWHEGFSESLCERPLAFAFLLKDFRRESQLIESLNGI